MQRTRTRTHCQPVFSLLAWVLALPALAFAQEEAPLIPEVAGGALSPADSLASMHVAPGLRVELVASEPQVADPVAIAFDEDGRLWVVEMADYPNGPPEGQPPLSRIRLLEDRDGDGHYELSRIFADGILFPNGIQPWHGGVIVTAAPYILYLKDTDDDGRADYEQKLFEGFAAENPQLRVNHPTFGLDNWIYVANGLRGGKVQPLATGDGKSAEPVSVSGRDFRFRLTAPADPNQSRDRQGAPSLIVRDSQPVTGPGQFGLTFDDWGRRFVCDNRHHLRLAVMEDRYTQRNPYLAAPSLLDDIPVHGADAEVFSLGRAWTTSSLHAGTFTACCGVHVYRGDLLPEEFRGNAFVCEPPGSLVHRDVIEPAGATLKARRAREGVEFLASTDDWFRPVNLATGPDGALYVVDMYRAIIEHPEFMPAELKGRPELALGRNKGRIYRIVPDGPAAATPKPQLSEAGVAELVRLLEHSNAWWRETAQRLLVERQDRDAVAPLDKLLRASENPRARIHAAWTLHGLGELETRRVKDLLADPDPRVREHALLLAEPTLRNDPSQLWGSVRGLVGDPDARVRFQAALALGELPADFKKAHESDFTAALAEVAGRDADDPWTRLAIGSAVPEHAGALADYLLTGDGIANDASTGRLALVRELFAIVGSRQDERELDTSFTALFQRDADKHLAWQMAALEGLAGGVSRRGGRLEQLVQRIPEPRRQRVENNTRRLFASIAELATQQDQSVSRREHAVQLLRHAPAAIAVDALVSLLGPTSPQEIEQAAIRSLAAQRDDRIPELLLARWSTATPPTRREIIAALLRTPTRARSLLDAIEQQQVLAGELTSTEARRLLEHRDAAVKQQAQALLQTRVPEERQKVLAQYQAALKLPSDAQRGRAVFEKNCATCHRVAGIGTDVAPDISDSRTRTREALLNDILNPNAAIDNNYVQYTVETQDGRVLTGIIASETASSITLRRAADESDTVLRQDIASIFSSGVSLMPEGLEKDVPLEDMAHLIAFLKDWRYLQGSSQGVEESRSRGAEGVRGRGD